ncbi:MAG: cyclodeaminase/cyclohydrolase family protein [Lachnospiraceae bacterium]|jgi:formiminotetrahydrofolate cyclodeaminase|nr:cyclodeaminase/cyclohydrolase family protein [Lachnospiraceae bacterium]MCH4064507.1 cyclodeaminase/cyclohydrolase family protein [Lachnospiraceae bacterium]MCH4104738.1 cyclodeaminase/cyclohydrolase family protein [Lachnospiraceae bacterium]MCI1308619.1 cyclodeaminase/cyclohydrolase family protein [Lachnospiraceae bacterium]MCI1333288.1 cyclodeaminase/cyclohydrolase family protein [Lachnospiraceae bacterium]
MSEEEKKHPEPEIGGEKKSAGAPEPAHPVMTDEQVYAILNAESEPSYDWAERKKTDEIRKDEPDSASAEADSSGGGGTALSGTEASNDHAGDEAEKSRETIAGTSAAGSLADLSVSGFSRALASEEPVPGGGGAAALTAALAASAGAMVGHLTVGKKKYAAVREDMERLIGQLDSLRTEFLSMIDGDAEAFRPLAEAYAMPHATDEEKEKRNEVMETCLQGAALAPLELIRALADLVEAVEEVAEKGSAIAVSDAGVAACLAGGAMKIALLNVYANTGLMKNRRRAKAMNTEAMELVSEYAARAERVYGRITERLTDQ